MNWFLHLFWETKSQNQLIQAILKEGSSVNSLLNYRVIFDALGANIRTNMKFEDTVDLQANYREAVRNVEQLYFEKGTGNTIETIWYYNG